MQIIPDRTRIHSHSHTFDLRHECTSISGFRRQSVHLLLMIVLGTQVALKPCILPLLIIVDFRLFAAVCVCFVYTLQLIGGDRRRPGRGREDSVSLRVCINELKPILRRQHIVFGQLDIQITNLRWLNWIEDVSTSCLDVWCVSVRQYG